MNREDHLNTKENGFNKLKSTRIWESVIHPTGFIHNTIHQDQTIKKCEFCSNKGNTRVLDQQLPL